MKFDNLLIKGFWYKSNFYIKTKLFEKKCIEFKTIEASSKWAEKYYSDLIKNSIMSTNKKTSEFLKSDIKNEYTVGELMYIYINTAYHHNINKSLRDKNTPEDKNDIVKKMKPLITKLYSTSVKEDIVVYRFLMFNYLKEIANKEKIKFGTMLTERGFLSASLVYNEIRNTIPYSSYDCVLKILIPKGTFGAYVASFSKVEEEQEFLIPPTTKLMVIEYKGIKNKKRVYLCKVIEQNKIIDI